VDAKQAELRAESLIRRTDLLRSQTHSSSFRSSSSNRSIFTHHQETPEVAQGTFFVTYGKKNLLHSFRSEHFEIGHFESVRKIFEKSRSDLYKRLAKAFSSDCGCEEE
jgi:hypothetical protein